MPSSQRRGRWSGVPLADRQALRREHLINAGARVLGDPSGAPLTVRAVCKQAGLTERYFYESFTDRDQFVRAVYDDVGTRAMTALAPTTSARQAVEQFVALMVDDPILGRVLLLGPETEPALARSGSEWMPNFIGLLQHKLTRIGDPVSQQLVATSLIGGLSSLFSAYLNGRLDADRGQFIDFCVDMLVLASRLEPAPTGPRRTEPPT
ncbi:TetR/AcrR family transcriptional regulator [Mycolicibacillus trivialis]|uniref:TetR/AcrR family transcriptional regulator n=1 Tax=Mycolicibacillus trivialis TaxID=1798 RepID=UPI000A15E505|nr:TetR/AcrR family transcriptional regulator [Mycolicibacillus trivialis]